MKVYELMSELAKLSGGDEITVGLCITTQELSKGDEIERDCYSLILRISSIDDGRIYTEAP